MSADSNLVFLGVRRAVTEGEIESLELRQHPVMKAARANGLQCYWGNFGSGEPPYLLFVGRKLGATGIENDIEVVVTEDALRHAFEEVSRKLAAAGIEGELNLYVQWQPDF